MSKLRITLIKEIESEETAQQLYDQLKTLIAPAEPIEKDARIIDTTVLT